MQATIPRLLLAGLLLKLLVSVFHRVRTAFFSPLSCIPGPWYAALSDLWLSSHLLRFKQSTTIEILFRTYGPVVRVGPNKVAFRDFPALKEVYLQRKFPKNAEFYDHFKIDGVEQVLTLADNESHTARRKVLGSHYTITNIMRMQPHIDKTAVQMLESLDHIDARIPVDCLPLFRSYMVDIVIYSSFGYDSGAVQKWTVNAVDHISDAITDFPKMAILSSLVPAWVWSALCQIPHERLKRFTRTSHILKEFVAHRIQEVHELEGTEESETATLIQRLLQDRKNTSKKALAVPLATSESVAHLIAGSETSSMTLAYLLWQLTRSPEVHIKLRAEVDDTMPDSRSIPDLGILQELPYLNAFIQEGMRVHSVVPALLERIVPPGPDFQLREYAIPPGTVVGTQAWSVHKSDDVFPSPERFDPERWLDETSDGATTRLAHLMPFGLGTRICVGRPLAESALRIAITALVRNFIITADASTTEESMEMKHGFANFPASGECKLLFTPRVE